MATERSHDLRPEPRLAEITRLRRLAMRDELTGLANRRAFLQRLDADIARAGRRKAPFSLVLLDLDGLKDLNDTFGHHAGDAALRSFGRALRRAVRAEDLVARIGGDEFAVVGTHARADEAPAFAARVEAVARGLVRRVTPRGQRVRISAAMGYATWDGDIPDAETLFARAESELLAAKHPADVQPSPLKGIYQPRGRRALGEELRRLLAMARSVSSARELRDLARSAAEHAAALIGAGEAAIALPRPDGRTGYDPRYVDGAWVEVPEGWYERGKGAIGHVMETAEPLVINEPRDDPHLDRATIARPGTENIMCLPLRHPSGGALGVLCLTNKRAARGFAEGDVRLGMAFADLVASAIANVHAREREAAAHLYVRSLMDQASDAIYITDPVTRRILDVNEATQRISGYTREQLLQMRATDLRLPADRDGPATDAMPRDSDGVMTHPRRHRRADGMVIPVEVSARRIRTPRGEVVMNVVRVVSDAVVAERELQRDVVFRFAAACEARNPDTTTHLQQIRTLTELLARELGLSDSAVEELALASVLHDAGKARTPDAVLRKPGKLSQEELRVMRQHTIDGEAMLTGPDFYETARRIARSHHERWDGSGYPDGLAGEHIPRAARIVAVADVFDALITSRPWRPAWPVDQAVREIVASAGRRFDPRVVEAFESLWRGGRLPVRPAAPER